MKQFPSNVCLNSDGNFTCQNPEAGSSEDTKMSHSIPLSNVPLCNTVLPESEIWQDFICTMKTIAKSCRSCYGGEELWDMFDKELEIYDQYLDALHFQDFPEIVSFWKENNVKFQEVPKEPSEEMMDFLDALQMRALRMERSRKLSDGRLAYKVAEHLIDVPLALMES